MPVIILIAQWQFDLQHCIYNIFDDANVIKYWTLDNIIIE